MGTITLNRASQDNQQQWKTQEYHGKQIHVCTALRVDENKALPGHGQQWISKSESLRTAPDRRLGNAPAPGQIRKVSIPRRRSQKTSGLPEAAS